MTEKNSAFDTLMQERQVAWRNDPNSNVDVTVTMGQDLLP